MDWFSLWFCQSEICLAILHAYLQHMDSLQWLELGERARNLMSWSRRLPLRIRYCSMVSYHWFHCLVSLLWERSASHLFRLIPITELLGIRDRSVTMNMIGYLQSLPELNPMHPAQKDYCLLLIPDFLSSFDSLLPSRGVTSWRTTNFGRLSSCLASSLLGSSGGFLPVLAQISVVPSSRSGCPQKPQWHPVTSRRLLFRCPVYPLRKSTTCLDCLLFTSEE